MQKNSLSQFGIFNPRILSAFALFSVGVAMLGFAANPPAGVAKAKAPMSAPQGSSPGSTCQN
jgi:hypothetical protein